MTVLDLLAADETTVLFSFDDPNGAVNPNAVKTKFMADFDVGTIEPSPSIFRTAQGASRIGEPVVDPVEMNFSFTATATTYANLATGLGVLARWLRDPPGPLRFVDGSVTRYYDLLGTTALPTLFRGQAGAGLVVGRFSSVGPIPLRLLRQPWTRGAEVSVTGVTVPDDPATSTKVRVYPLTVTGDLPTPGRVKVAMDSGSTVERTLIAHRAQGSKPSASMSDYLAETGFAQVEASGRGWTRTLGLDTTGATDANASPGSGTSVARTTAATQVSGPTERVKLTRTTLMESLRGSWDVWVRLRTTAAAYYTLQLRWSPAATGEPVFTEAEVVHDTSFAASGVYVEKMLGTIYIPEGTTALGGLQLRLCSHRVSGGGDLDWDLVWFVPHEHQGTVTIAAGPQVVIPGRYTITPLTSPAGGTGAVIDGTKMRLDTTTDNVGEAPNAGTVLPAGRHRATFTIENEGTTGTIVVRVRNVTAGTDTVTSTVSPPNGLTDYTLTFDANGTSAYQVQVDDPSIAAVFLVAQITREFIPALTNGEALRTDPGLRRSVDRLDSSANLAGYLTIEGELPAMLQPGLNHLMVRADEVPFVGYVEGENKLTRTPTVSVTYFPRYAL